MTRESDASAAWFQGRLPTGRPLGAFDPVSADTLSNANVFDWRLLYEPGQWAAKPTVQSSLGRYTAENGSSERGWETRLRRS